VLKQRQLGVYSGLDRTFLAAVFSEMPREGCSTSQRHRPSFRPASRWRPFLMEMKKKLLVRESRGVNDMKIRTNGARKGFFHMCSWRSCSHSGCRRLNPNFKRQESCPLLCTAERSNCRKDHGRRSQRPWKFCNTYEAVFYLCQTFDLDPQRPESGSILSRAKTFTSDSDPW